MHRKLSVRDSLNIAKLQGLKPQRCRGQRFCWNVLSVVDLDITMIAKEKLGILQIRGQKTLPNLDPVADPVQSSTMLDSVNREVSCPGCFCSANKCRGRKHIMKNPPPT